MWEGAVSDVLALRTEERYQQDNSAVAFCGFMLYRKALWYNKIETAAAVSSCEMCSW